VIGQDAVSKDLVLNNPIQSGFIKNWDDMEDVWFYIYEKLNLEPEECPTLFAETPSTPEYDRKELACIMFETFRLPSLFLASDAALSLYSEGKITGVVLDSGYEVTRITPVFGGFTAIDRLKNIKIGARQLSNYLIKMVKDKAIITHDTADQIKDQLCYVALDFESEQTNIQNNQKTFILPDGENITLSDEMINPPETLFKPQITKKRFLGVHEMISNVICSSDIDLRHDYYNNILCTGGNSMYPGLEDRLQKEIKSVAPSSMHVNVEGAKDKLNSVFIGGTVLASMQSFANEWISKSEYDEFGSDILLEKFK